MGRAGRLRYRHLRRTVIAAPAALAVFLLLALLLWRTLESEALCDFAARRLEGATERLTGLELRIEDLGWGLLPPRIELWGLKLDGEGAGLQTSRVTVELAGVWIAQRTLVIDTVEIDGLKVELHEPSLPARRRSEKAPFRILLRHLDLRDVAVSGSGLPGRLELEIEGFEMSWVRDGAETSGYMTVERLDLDVPSLEAFGCRMEARFTRRGQEFELPIWRVIAPGVALQGEAVFSAEYSKARAAGEIDLEELDRLIRAKNLLKGAVNIDAEFDSRNEVLARAEVIGSWVEVANLPLTDLRAELRLSREGLRGEVAHARLFGGLLTGSYELGRLGSPYPHRVRGACEGLHLASFLEALGVPSGGLSARAGVEAEVGWNSSHFPRGSGLARVKLTAEEGPLPVNGLLDLTLVPQGLLQFRAQELHVGASIVNFEGPLRLKTWQPEWAIHIEPVVLEEILPAANRWIGSRAIPEMISGEGVGDVSLSGPWNRLRVGFRLDIEDLMYPPIKLDRAIIEASVGEGELRFTQGRFMLGDGSGEVRGALRWQPSENEEALDLRFEGRQLSLSRVASWLGLEGITAGGRFSLTGGLGGPLKMPRGSWALGMTDVEVASQKLGNGSASVDLSTGAFTVGNLDFDRGLSGRVRWRVGEGLLEGDLEWREMEAIQFPSALKRLFGDLFTWDLSFLLPLKGGSPEGSLSVTTDQGRVGVEFDREGLTAAGELPGVAAAELDILNGDEETGWRGRGDLTVESVAGLVDLLAPALDVPLTGTSKLSFSLAGEGTMVHELAGAISQTDLFLGGRQIRLLKDEGFVWDQQGFRLRGIETAMGADPIFLRAAVDPRGELTGNLSGTLDGRLLRVLIPDWEPAGRATGDVELTGTFKRPQLEGTACVEEGSFHLPGSRSVIGDVNGTLFFSAGEVALEDVDFRFMRGAGRCRGKIHLRDRATELRLKGTVEGLQFPLFPGLVPRVDGAWALNGPAEDLELSGDMVITRGEVRGQDDLPTLLMDWFGEEKPPRDDSLRLDLRVRAEETLKAQGPFLRVTGSADLHVTGTDANPGLVGRVEFSEGGEFTLQGIRYELERGQISFSDPTRIDPLLDFQARSRILEYEVWLRLGGTLDRLVPTVSSDPPLNQAEIYSLMAMGQVGEGRAGGALGISLASSMLTRQLNQTLGGRDSWLLPVDQIRVDPFIESATGNPAARVTVVKQLSPSVTVTVQSNLSGERKEVMTVRWYIGSGFFVEGTRDSDASLGLDFKLRRRY
ncbi:MAG: translocation/assembly module TamB domain-containing protein [Thermoanaerobaculales bacterium]|nr:translocation/assembly module TamB domain-containing protein [Thermoanaerobaculales bacterium]